jgi:hypothetical protein
MASVKSRRAAQNVDNAIVYRRENDFASHPVRGFWETAAGLDLQFLGGHRGLPGDPNQLAHTGLVAGAGGRRSMTVRSEIVAHLDHREPGCEAPQQ